VKSFMTAQRSGVKSRSHLGCAGRGVSDCAINGWDALLPECTLRIVRRSGSRSRSREEHLHFTHTHSRPMGNWSPRKLTAVLHLCDSWNTYDTRGICPLAFASRLGLGTVCAPGEPRIQTSMSSDWRE